MTTGQSRAIRQPTIDVHPDATTASLAVASEIARLIETRPECVLGLATGGTPIESYRALIERHKDDGLDFSSVTTFNLDEYVGLGPEHPQSYRRFMQEQLFDHVNVRRAQTHVPNGLAEDLDQQGADYEKEIASAGGIDLQLLGIGHNGHIAFNEPGAARDSRTRVVPLASQTVEKNARFFDSIDDVPRTAITMGIGTILEAKRILLLATGRGKAEAVRLAIEGPVHEEHPASLLRLHNHVTFVLDQNAASELTRG